MKIIINSCLILDNIDEFNINTTANKLQCLLIASEYQGDNVEEFLNKYNIKNRRIGNGVIFEVEIKSISVFK